MCVSQVLYRGTFLFTTGATVITMAQIKIWIVYSKWDSFERKTFVLNRYSVMLWLQIKPIHTLVHITL